MNRSEFLKLEYETLREEIKETKSRLFKLAGLGVVGMPSAYSLAQVYKIDVLILSLPILICTLVLLYLSESGALMRCGRYIRVRIEAEITNGAGRGVNGWEHWLEERAKGEPNRRRVDQFLAVFFYLVFVFYYVASVSLAAGMAKVSYGDVGFAVALGAYVALGILSLYFLFSGFRRITTTVD